VEIKEFLQENGEEVQRISYTNQEDFKVQIKEVMKKLRAEKVDAADVAFLAPKKYSNSILHEIGFEVNELGDTYNPGSPLPKFATIQGFKGLDAKIVVLVDVDEIYPKHFSKFIYIAGTRARTLLYVIGSNEFWKNNDKLL